MTLGVRKSAFLGLVILVVATLGLAFRWDMHVGIDKMSGLLIDQAGSITDIVAEASSHGLQTYQQWEGEIARRLINNARWVAWVDSTEGIDKAGLARLVPLLGLHQIWILDAAGNLEATNPHPAGGKSPRHLPAVFLQSLVDGRTRQAKLGFHKDADDGSWCYVAGAARAGGGAVVVDCLADSLVLVRREMGPGHLIKAIGDGRAIKYVAIQDETGIQAASSMAMEFLPPGNDPYLAPLAGGQEWVAKEFDSPLGWVFEVARVMPLPGGDVLLRVGLDAAPLQQLRGDIRRKTVTRAGILVVTVLLISALTMAWQRQGVLDKEVVKISRKLAMREEEARRGEKLVAMGSLAAGVAHQIRNPLNSIHMIAQVLDRSSALDPQLRQQAGLIRKESSRIESIVQQFLQFARPRAPMFEDLDLAELVREVVDVQEAANHDNGLIYSTYAPGLWAEVDRQFVIEVLENLLRNAAQALGGSGKILVSLIGSGDYAEIVVEDNGPGVPLEIRDRIFDLYFTTRPEGSGLGLSLAAQMVGAMGGTLRLAQEHGLEGCGARFVMRLPLRRKERAAR